MRKAQRTALRFGDDADDDSPITKHNGTRHGMEEGRNIEYVQVVPLQLSTGIARAPFLRDNEPDPTGPVVSNRPLLQKGCLSRDSL